MRVICGMLAAALLTAGVLTPARADQVIITEEVQAAEAVDFIVQADVQVEQLQRAVRLRPAAAPADPAAETADEDKPADAAGEDNTSEEVIPAPPPEPVDPEVMKLHLRDGSILTGKLDIKDLLVDTQFGRLTIPITSILSFRPGLDSVPEFSQKINDLIAALGADDYNQREAAQKELVNMGAKVRRVLEQRLKDEDNAERTRRIKQILEGIEEQVDDSWGEESGSKEWIQRDTIVTTDFTVVGTIVQKQFGVDSKYGPLTVKLGDIDHGKRNQPQAQIVRRSVDVDGSHIAQRSFKSTNIRVNAGDRISFNAEGQITMTPWGSNAITGPDGATNYGMYSGTIPAGCLVGRIGDSDEPFQIGSRATITAKKSGVLQLAIGMNPSYANNAYPGKYTVRVTVTPK